MKKSTIIIIITMTIMIIMTIFFNLQLETKTQTEKIEIQTNIRESKVVDVYVDEYGKFIDFENRDIGCYIGTVNENLWKLVEEVEIGDTVVFDTMGTESIEDDIIIEIK